MQVIVALENVIKTFTFPDDAKVYTNSGMCGFIQVASGIGQLSWFNPTYVIAIVPGTKAGG